MKVFLKNWLFALKVKLTRHGQIFHQDTHVANKHMKRCWTFLVIRETEINATTRYPYTPVRIAKVK